MIAQREHAGSEGLELLAQDWLKHLEQEEQGLEEARDALREMRTALLNGNVLQLEDAWRRQEDLACSLHVVRKQRSVLCGAISQRLGVPASQTTLRRLAEFLPPTVAEPLMSARARLCGLAAEVDALNRRNATLARSCLGVVQRCLNEVFGEGNAVARYGPSGEHLDVPRGPFLEARG